ncbi:G-type lectin S-receptor-like serine/threonine-protein kinase At1g67520 isoform X3 [Populus alba]|uniref:G-type lectin S-receptor-like serine/threonine-protein kinase At1g67520 isoform X3 n=1 Tax=Populus alba TaxID=43335 RepID=UPI003CC76571
MSPSMARRIYRFLLFCFCASHVLAADTLYQGGDSLNSSITLVSKNGLFTLGFTRLGSAESNASYLGIWYNNDTSHPFWLANRGKPIADNSGVLAIDGSGNMKLTYSGGHPVEFYSSQSSASNITASLEDSGNFVLKDENSGSQQVLWQSFDFPTDTFLPGMKLGINHRTGHTWSLMSWLSDLVPTPAGAFTFEWDTNGTELVIKRRDVIYWTSGPLRSNTSFENFFLNAGDLNFSFINDSNADEDYFMFTVSANQFTPQGQRNFSMWQLRYDGSIADRSTGRVYGGSTCKGNNTDGGCERWSGPACRSNRNSFELRSGSFVSTVPRKDDYNSSLSISDCMDICWKDCQCVGVTTRGNNANNTGCTFYYGSFTPDPSGRSVQYHIIVQEELFLRHDTAGKGNWVLIVLAFVGFVSMMGLAGLLWYLRRRRLREKDLIELLTLDSTNDTLELENDGNRGHNLTIYSAATIMAATNSFSADNKLGQGGFGPVYKAKY